MVILARAAALAGSSLLLGLGHAVPVADPGTASDLARRLRTPEAALRTVG